MMREQQEETYREFRSVVQALADELETGWEKQKADRTIRGKDLVDRAKVILAGIREKLLKAEVVKRCDLEQDIKLCRGGSWWREINSLTMDLPHDVRRQVCLWIWSCDDGEAYTYYNLRRRRPELGDKCPKSVVSFFHPDPNWRIAGEDEIRCKVLEFLRWYATGCQRQ